MNKLYYLALSLLFIFSTLTSSLSVANIFNAEQAQLGNGMSVVVIPNHRAPVIHHMVWYKAGAAQEGIGQTGTAHFLEHLLFKGTDKIPSGEFSKTVRALGGEDNAFTSYDYTAYFQTIAKEHLETVMEMEADRMRHAKPSQEDVLLERDVVLEERRQRTENKPVAKFFEILRPILYPEHPYGRPVIGWDEELKKLNWDISKEFYDTWYTPQNAILVVSGDITLDELMPLAEKTYGSITPLETLPKRVFPDLPAPIKQERITIKDTLVTEPLIVIGIRAPSYAQDKKTALALTLLENMMSAGASTYLYKTLVVEDKKAINASLSYNGDLLDTGSLWITATPAEDVSLEDLEKSLLETINAYIPEKKDLEEAKERLKNSAIFARDSLSGPAHIIGRALASGSTLNDIETWPKQIDAVSLSEVQEALKTYIQDAEKYSITGQLIPENNGTLKDKKVTTE